MHLLQPLMAWMCLASMYLPTQHAKLAPDEDFDPNSCSVYCAACPDLRVSSHLAGQGRCEYDEDQLQDGEASTAWVVKDGPGQWFEFDFEEPGFHPDVKADNNKVGIDTLYIHSGYCKSAKTWSDHSRPKELLLSVNGVPVLSVTLLDDRRPQKVDLPRTILKRHTKFRFTIVSVYPGAKFHETAVSDVRLDGFGAH